MKTLAIARLLSRRLKAILSVVHCMQGRPCPRLWNNPAPPCTAAAWPRLCPPPAAPAYTKQQHLIPGALLPAQRSAVAPWGQKETSVQTSLFGVKTYLFVLSEFNQLRLARSTSTSYASQLLSETMDANHLQSVHRTVCRCRMHCR